MDVIDLTWTGASAYLFPQCILGDKFYYPFYYTQTDDNTEILGPFDLDCDNLLFCFPLDSMQIIVRPNVPSHVSCDQRPVPTVSI